MKDIKLYDKKFVLDGISGYLIDSLNDGKIGKVYFFEPDDAENPDDLVFVTYDLKNESITRVNLGWKEVS